MSGWLIAELALLIMIIICQLVLSLVIYVNIGSLKNIFQDQIFIKNGYLEKKHLNNRKGKANNIFFIDNTSVKPDGFNLEQDYISIAIADTTGEGIVKRICDDINNYLLNNHGATVNFSIIKDIIDREIDVKDEEISHSIPTPLYLGLAATMIGIIFGLFSMPEMDGGDFSIGINSLIDGVKIAMVGSLVGLMCTTILSALFYKNAKKQVLEDKNSNISYLQAMLLPELVKAEEYGLPGLKASIDKFSRDTDSTVKELNNTVIKTESNLVLQNQIIEKQSEVIKKIEEINVTKISKTNLELLGKLESNIKSFSAFSEYLDLMGKISEQLQEFASKTASIDTIIKNIDLTFVENKKLNEFLSRHFDKIELAGNAALNAVDVADAHFKTAIEKLTESNIDAIKKLHDSIITASNNFNSAIDALIEEVNARIQAMNKASSENEVNIKKIYEEIGESLRTIADEHMNQLRFIFKEATPNFAELKYLMSLPEIKALLTSKNSGKTVGDVLIELNESLSRVRDNISPQNILNKLDSIEKNLQNRKMDTLHFPRKKGTPPQPPRIIEDIPDEKPQPVTIYKLIKETFN